MPMMLMAYRFEHGAPDRATFLRDVTRELGPATERVLEDVAATADRVSWCSMDVVAMVYAARVCERAGGVAIDFKGEDVPVTLPAWSSVPWTRYSAWRRLRIRFGRIRLGPGPSPG